MTHARTAEQGDEEWLRKDAYNKGLCDADSARILTETKGEPFPMSRFRDWRKSRGLPAKRQPRPEVFVVGQHFKMSLDAFEARMRIYREGRKLSLAQAARIAGITTRAYSMWMRDMDLPNHHIDGRAIHAQRRKVARLARQAAEAFKDRPILQPDEVGVARG